MLNLRQISYHKEARGYCSTYAKYPFYKETGIIAQLMPSIIYIKKPGIFAQLALSIMPSIIYIKKLGIFAQLAPIIIYIKKPRIIDQLLPSIIYIKNKGDFSTTTTKTLAGESLFPMDLNSFVNNIKTCLSRHGELSAIKLFVRTVTVKTTDLTVTVTVRDTNLTVTVLVRATDLSVTVTVIGTNLSVTVTVRDTVQPVTYCQSH